MVFSKFRIKTTTRVLLIAIVLFAFVFAIYQDKWYVTSVVCGLAAIFQLIELIHFLESSNRELGKFLLAVKYKDFSNYQSSHLERTSDELKSALNEISKEFQNVRIEKELHYQYLQTVFAHSKTAIICFSLDGKVQLSNTACKNLLGFKRIENIEELSKINAQLLESIKSIKANEETLIKLNLNNQILQLSIQSTLFKLKNESYKMVSLHDVKEVLEEQELDSWKKLIRVLNHEIMNSVTPISSLSKSLNLILQDETSNNGENINLSKEDSNDLTEGLQTIENRSKGLLKFVTNYKKISKLPQPNYSEVNVLGLVKHILLLLKNKIDELGFEIETDIGEELAIIADHELIEQLIINLLLNAFEAPNNSANKIISIRAYQNETNSYIEITDNGVGIEDEILEQIFIPFYTTKKEGSGIGLSISKQIMQLHRGNLSVHTKLGIGSTFVLKFI